MLTSPHSSSSSLNLRRQSRPCLERYVRSLSSIKEQKSCECGSHSRSIADSRWCSERLLPPTRRSGSAVLPERSPTPVRHAGPGCHDYRRQQGSGATRYRRQRRRRHAIASRTSIPAATRVTDRAPGLPEGRSQRRDHPARSHRRLPGPADGRRHHRDWSTSPARPAKQIDLRSVTIHAQRHRGRVRSDAEGADLPGRWRSPRRRSTRATSKAGFQVNGASGAENSFTVDGVVTNSLVNGTSRQNTVFEYLQEVQVKTGGIRRRIRRRARRRDQRGHQVGRQPFQRRGPLLLRRQRPERRSGEAPGARPDRRHAPSSYVQDDKQKNHQQRVRRLGRWTDREGSAVLLRVGARRASSAAPTTTCSRAAPSPVDDRSAIRP